MKRWLRSAWFWLALVFVLLLSALLFVGQSTSNVMYPALDTLAKVQLSDRWSHPELLKIRALGPKAIPPLRSVLRERDSPSTRLLLWVKAKWPAATKYYSRFPDLSKMSERRWTACQVIQTLGPAGRAAAPELINIFRKGDTSDSNAASMALWAIGIDADMCEQLAAVLEQKGVHESSRCQIVGMLAKVKPPSERTLRALTSALADSSSWVQSRAAETVGQLGVSTPALVSALKLSKSTSTNEVVVVNASAAIWELEKNAKEAFEPVVRVLSNALARPIARPFGGGNGGQGVTAEDEVFMTASGLFQRMNLADSDKARALGLLDGWCEKSGRIFIRMLLLPGMMELGFPRKKCLEVCYYDLQILPAAINILGELGPSARLAAAALTALTSDPNPAVAKSASEALARIGR